MNDFISVIPAKARLAAWGNAEHVKIRHSGAPEGRTRNDGALLVRRITYYLFSIASAVRQPKALYRDASDQVLVDDLIHVIGILIAVPDGIRIDHGNRAFLAAIGAAAGIGAEFSRPIQAQFLEAALGMSSNRNRAPIRTAYPLAFALVDANEQMPTVKTHQSEKIGPKTY